MFLTGLALLPAIALVVWIYRQDKVEKELKAYLQDIGDCVVVVADDEIVKVHVHTNHPGLAFEKALTFGSLTSMKIDNMREEHQEKLIRDAETVASSRRRQKLRSRRSIRQTALLLFLREKV